MRRLLHPERSWTADERTVPKVKSQEAVRITGNADSDAFPDFARFTVTVAEPEGTRSAEIEPIEPTIDPQRCGEPSWSARQVAQVLNATI